MYELMAHLLVRQRTSQQVTFEFPNKTDEFSVPSLPRVDGMVIANTESEQEG